MSSAVRYAALEILRKVQVQRLDLANAQAEIRAGLIDKRDRALVTEIVIGTLRWRAKLDFIIQKASTRSLNRIDVDLLDLLRLSTYQLLHLDRVPAHAVVNEAVNLAGQLGKKSAAPYINAVLRTIERDMQSQHLPSRPSDLQQTDRSNILDYLSISQSHPRWLMERWCNRYGPESTITWTAFNNKAAPITLRVNTLKCSPARLANEFLACDIDTRPSTWSPHALIVTRGNPRDSPLASQGLFWLQDEASQLIGELVTAQPGDQILDTCAAPGGKALVIATHMEDRGLLIAADVRRARTNLLSSTFKQYRIQSTRVVRLDGRSLPFPAVMRWVVVDAPCSGLGTLRRDPDIRWKRTAEDLASFAKLQAELLQEASRVVESGGRILYSTCSSEPEENEHVVRQFLAKNPNFTIERPANPQIAPLIDEEGFFRTLPHRDGLEAFFAAQLKHQIP
jgi:16S rRNA (cytosine967-C5)-methyltransferase